MSFFRRAGALIAKILSSATDPVAESGTTQLYAKTSSGVVHLFARASNATIYQLTGGPPQSNLIVWKSDQSWASVYDVIQSMVGPVICLVERDDFDSFRTMTKAASPTNLWNILFMSVGQPHTSVGTIDIRTEDGLTLGLDPNGFARFQSKNISWQFETALNPAATGVPVACSIDGGQLNHNVGYGFVTDTFLCEVRNGGRIIGTGGTALVRLTGDNSSVSAWTGSTIGNSSFATTTGARTVNVRTDGSSFINGVAFGALVTPNINSGLSLFSPSNFEYTVGVDDAGFLTGLTADLTVAKLNVAQSFTKAQASATVALSNAASPVPVDASLSNTFTLTLNANRQLGTPSNLVDGGTYVFRIKQDGTGGRVLTFTSVWKFAVGVDPTITPAANALDVITATSDGTNMFCSYVQDVK